MQLWISHKLFFHLHFCEERYNFFERKTRKRVLFPRLSIKVLQNFVSNETAWVKARMSVTT